MDVLDSPQRHVLPDSGPPRILATSSGLSHRVCLPVPYPVFRPVHGPAAVHQS